MRKIHISGYVSIERDFFWVTVSRGTLSPVIVKSIFVSSLPDYNSEEKVRAKINSYIQELATLVFGVPHCI